ncbi:hypothetical protein H4R33_001325 [Dimargaris cristalligena]|uniref:Pyridoxal phosphate-dependent transferase n=1 Tax=Dimargaris cristalligena TaxID=215637 RepID=A0A4Q0A1V2_9FUNG|nr:hypothetical protein H4R33_001325 [Dimargaris cristalligena]RKP39451.1 pyridoxal phosphate-dependent transferase [Dimargaris cristalligena]|eukprot:RKP39451.1 pyridoxal phosphate-dependent transferase [Dimargaris cristalligena]
MTFDASQTAWDEKTQQFHGGQDWATLSNFVEDFSVTTNGLGTPRTALEAGRKAVDLCDHYPPANQEPAKSSLAAFLWPDSYQRNVNRLLLGNGASELIDLVVRKAPAGPWKPGPFSVQYKEYERSASTNGRPLLKVNDDSPAAIACIVNPCNPTGDYKPLNQLKKWVEANVQDGGFAVIDESMQPWHSPGFREDSMTSQTEFVADLYARRGISVYVIHSWTKLWSCTGIRLGSIVCPTEEHCQALKKIQVPWSVNCVALAFLHAVVKDEAYLHDTWTLTPRWRHHTVAALQEYFPNWLTSGEPFLSWVWIDTGDMIVAERAIQLAKQAGVPVRSGLPGYQQPSHLRIAVRSPEKFQILLNAWLPLRN